jgi:hypothetical protein
VTSARPLAVTRASPRVARDPTNNAPGLAMRFLNGSPVECDDPELLLAAIWDLEDRIQLEGSVEDAQFPEFARTDRAIEAARAQLMVLLKKLNSERRQQEIYARTTVSQQEYEEWSEMMAQREEALEARLREQLFQLRARQERECAEHDARWMVEPKQRLFNRSSQKVRILRIQRQLLVTAHRFDDALQVSQIGHKVQADETIEHHFQMQAGFEASRVLLDQKHEEELDTLLQAIEVKRNEFRYIRDSLAVKFTNRFRVLKTEEDLANDPERLWVRTRRNDTLEIAITYGTSPRRKVVLSKLANVAEFNTLSLPPLDMDSPARKRNKFATVK